MNEKPKSVRDHKQPPLDIVQLHGDETPEDASDIKQQTRALVWKVFHHEPGVNDTLEHMTAFAQVSTAFSLMRK